MTSVFTFCIACAVVVLNAYIARAVALIFVKGGIASVAAFSFMLGLVPASISKLTDINQLIDPALLLGSLAGLMTTWWLYFQRDKREKAHG